MTSTAKTLKLTLMGCGNSTGVPAAGNRWGACDPNEPRNLRTRCSALFQSANTNIVIDTGPDFRQQVNKADVQKLDAVLYTHAHSDHMNGIDDLRVYVFRQKQLMPVYASRETFDDLKGYFPYMFHGGKIDLYPPLLDEREIKDFGKAFTIGDIDCIPLRMDHGSCVATGYRIGNAAYCVDFINLDDAAVEILKGIDIWIVDAAGYRQTDSKVHANLQTIFNLNKRIGAKTVVLTSLSLAMDYNTLINELPAGYIPAHDGISFDITF